MVTTKNWDLRRPTRKLAEQSAGPFRIAERVGNAYRLELPESIKVHPVFSPEKLRRAAKTEPLSGQTADPQPPITVDGQDEWEVEQILAVRLIRKRLFYRVKWLGHDDDLTWYCTRPGISRTRRTASATSMFNIPTSLDPRNAWQNG